MSEEKKNEVLGQEKDLDESEMEAVSGGALKCAIAGDFCPLGGEKEKECCGCILVGVHD